MPSHENKPTVRARAAYVEEVNEDGERVRGTMRTASTKKKSEKSDRSSRSAKEKEKKSRSDSGYSSHAANVGSDTSSPPLSRAQVANGVDPSKEERQSRRKSTSGSPTKSPRKSSKPPSVHRNDRSVNFLPSLEIPIRSKNDPSFYGVSPNSSAPVSAPARTTTMPNASRPTRPQSFYGGMPIPTHDSRPPLAPSAYFVAPTPVMSQPTSYPPSPSPSFMNYAATTQQPDSYFAPQPQSRARPLAERFVSQHADPIHRTASASGIKEFTQGFYNYNGYEVENPKSIRMRSKEMEDLRAMPPPPKPEMRHPTIRRVTTTDSRDMPGTFPITHPEEEDDGRWDRRMSRSIRHEEAPRRRSSVSRSRAYTYEPDVENTRVRIEAPNGRRRSYYDDGPVPRSTSYEDKLRHATGYQEEVAGGPPIKLTAESLRRSQGPSGSSRSTRSSGSRDESDFKRSSTTRTTTSRSGQGQDGDDVTIRFRGGAIVNVAGAEIKCDDGAELNIVRRKSIRNGSERSASEYGTVPDDRQSRGSRPVNISRSNSKSGYSNPQYNPWVEQPWAPRIRGD